MQRKHGMRTYIWKAEYQSNGQLHYHILTPSWIHYEKIRNDWNNTLEQHGFLSQWRKNYGQKVPNSTDIHAVYKLKNIEAYLMKYLSKKEKFIAPDGAIESFYDENDTKKNDAPLEKKGKVWDCSMNLKKCKMFSVQLPNCLEYLYEVPERVSLDNCIIIKCQNPSFVLPPGLLLQYKKWINSIVSDS